MGKKHVKFGIYLLTIVIVLTFILAVVAYIEVKPRRYDSYQKQFLAESGFLTISNSGKQALCNYSESIKILKVYGTNNRVLGNSEKGVDWTKVTDLLMEGAKFKALGTDYQKESPSLIVVKGCGKLEVNDLVLLPQDLINIYIPELKEKQDYNQMGILGEAVLAVGVQFDCHDDLAFRPIGLFYKGKGLEILEYLGNADNEKIMASVKIMKKEFEKETRYFKQQSERMVKYSYLDLFLRIFKGKN